MARGRFISKSIATDLAVNSMSIEAHLLYVMAIPHLDRDGRILGDKYVLFGTICPRRPELLDNLEDAVSEWTTAGLVSAHSHQSTGIVLYFRGFTKNQHGMRYDREPPSTLPPMPEVCRKSAGSNPQMVGLSIREVKEEVEVKEEEQEQDEPLSSSFLKSEHLLINLLKREGISHDYLDVEHALKGGASPEWIEEAINIAAGNGKTHWPYVAGILKNWREKGRPKGDNGNDRKYYIPDDLKDIIVGYVSDEELELAGE